MVNWKTITREEAEEKYQDYCKTKEITIDESDREIRDDLIKLFQQSLSDIGILEMEISQKNNSYQLDLVFGLKLYQLLNGKYGMRVRQASDDGIWRYLSTCVVPDLVEKRYGIEHQDRFWKKPKRLWLRVIWWYIYLSWQGSEKETFEVLRGNSTDEILQLVDRCGRGGYRVELYRELMRKNSEIDIGIRRSSKVFRKMMVLNTARVQVMEPELAQGGTRGYVDSLCEYVQ